MTKVVVEKAPKKTAEDLNAEALIAFRQGLHTLIEGTGSTAYIQAAWRHQVLTDTEARKKFRAALQVLVDGVDSLRHPDDAQAVPEYSAPVEQGTNQPEPRNSPRPFNRPGTDDTVKILDLCAKGLTNREIAAVVGCSAGMVSRIRAKSQWVENRFEIIDEWVAKHPGANLHAWRTRGKK